MISMYPTSWQDFMSIDPHPNHSNVLEGDITQYAKTVTVYAESYTFKKPDGKVMAIASMMPVEKNGNVRKIDCYMLGVLFDKSAKFAIPTMVRSFKKMMPLYAGSYVELYTVNPGLARLFEFQLDGHIEFKGHKLWRYCRLV